MAETIDMRNIGIFMIVYDNDLCRAEYSICREHYERIIAQFGMQVTIYGVDYSQDATPSIENGMLHIGVPEGHTHEDCDRDTSRKWMDLVCCPILPQHDVYVRLTPSTIINLPMLYQAIQSPEYDPNKVYTSEGFEQYVLENGEVIRHHIYPRGNLVVMTANMMHEMFVIFDQNNQDYKSILLHASGTNDDSLIGALLLDIAGHKWGSYTTQAVSYNRMDRVSKLFDTMAICCKCEECQDNLRVANYVIGTMMMILWALEAHWHIQPVVYENSTKKNQWSVTTEVLQHWVNKCIG